MRHTSLTWQPDSVNNQADGYTSTGEPRPHPHRVRAAAASSMDTTIEDYARFVAGFARWVIAMRACDESCFIRA